MIIKTPLWVVWYTTLWFYWPLWSKSKDLRLCHQTVLLWDGLRMRLNLLYTVAMVTYTEAGELLSVVCLHVSGQGCMEVIAIEEIFCARAGSCDLQTSPPMKNWHSDMDHKYTSTDWPIHEVPDINISISFSDKKHSYSVKQEYE